ncbi:MAG: tetratricopeptide repeat protein [Planctomycetota bacterium]
MDLSDLEQAVALDPKHAEARLQLGLALIDAGRPSDALDHLRKAMILRRDFSEAYLGLGRALLAEGEHIAAIATLEGGREIATKTGRVELLQQFETALHGLGPVKRRSGAPVDESAFSEIAQKALADVAERVAALGMDILIQRSPGIVIFDIRRKTKLGLSEQKTPREIWCSCSMGEYKFRWIPSSGLWRTADGDELISFLGRFLSRETGGTVSL